MVLGQHAIAEALCINKPGGYTCEGGARQTKPQFIHRKETQQKESCATGGAPKDIQAAEQPVTVFKDAVHDKHRHGDAKPPEKKRPTYTPLLNLTKRRATGFHKNAKWLNSLTRRPLTETE